MLKENIKRESKMAKKPYKKIIIRELEDWDRINERIKSSHKYICEFEIESPVDVDRYEIENKIFKREIVLTKYIHSFLQVRSITVLCYSYTFKELITFRELEKLFYDNFTYRKIGNPK